MGQYYLTVNLDKGEYLDPHKFGDGLKLLEFGNSTAGTTMGLVALLADGNGRGGGDLRSENGIIGSWKGDRIVVAGDYADPNNFVPNGLKDELFDRMLEGQRERDAYKNGDIDEETAIKYARSNCNVYSLAREFYEDISENVIEALENDQYLKEELERCRHVSWKREIKDFLNRSKSMIQSLEERENGAKEELINRLVGTIEDLDKLEDYEYDDPLMA